MREIKFRAWDKMHSEMKMFPTNQCFFDLIGNDYGNQFMRFEVMQYTGLTDKNGKEIYEGDIVIPVDMHDENIDNWRMEYFKDGGSKAHAIPMTIKWLDYICGFDTPCAIHYWEIIGNIYENPEMIK